MDPPYLNSSLSSHKCINDLKYSNKIGACVYPCKNTAIYGDSYFEILGTITSVIAWILVFVAFFHLITMGLQELFRKNSIFQLPFSCLFILQTIFFFNAMIVVWYSLIGDILICETEVKHREYGWNLCTIQASLFLIFLRMSQYYWTVYNMSLGLTVSKNLIWNKYPIIKLIIYLTGLIFPLPYVVIVIIRKMSSPSIITCSAYFDIKCFENNSYCWSSLVHLITDGSFLLINLFVIVYVGIKLILIMKRSKTKSEKIMKLRIISNASFFFAYFYFSLLYFFIITITANVRFHDVVNNNIEYVKCSNLEMFGVHQNGYCDEKYDILKLIPVPKYSEFFQEILYLGLGIVLFLVFGLNKKTLRIYVDIFTRKIDTDLTSSINSGPTIVSNEIVEENDNNRNNDNDGNKV
eukprot:TRINITY_DN15769_c0_g1_i1.p1 TRINITY_DN15769_c0_g1~~TRINITY_DN15769_c0_g1_i1.p1  ORF type:complete len:408 (+),score=25.72 TRINITY_DN15769_c0_g1_i1:167-1390(+)